MPRAPNSPAFAARVPCTRPTDPAPCPCRTSRPRHRRRLQTGAGRSRGRRSRPRPRAAAQAGVHWEIYPAKGLYQEIEYQCIALDTCVLGKAQRHNPTPLYLHFKPCSPFGLVRLQGLLKAPAGRNARDLEIAWHIAPNGRAGGAVGAMGPALATTLRAVPLRQRALSIGAAPACACIRPVQIRDAVNFNVRPRLEPPRCPS